MSDNVVQGPDAWRRNAERSLAPEPSVDLAGGGGPPHDPGMEARLSAVEADAREVKGILQRLEPLLTRVDDRTRKIEIDVAKLGTDVVKVAVDLAELKGRVSQLPTALTIFGYMGSLVVLTLVLFGAAYGVLKFVAH